MSAKTEYLRIDGHKVTLVFALTKAGPVDLIYLGPKLPFADDLSSLADSHARGRHESQPDAPPVPGILPQGNAGYQGTPHLRLRDQHGHRIQTDLRFQSHSHEPHELCAVFADKDAQIDVHLTWSISAGDTVTCRTQCRNARSEPVMIDHLAALSLPLPRRFTEMTAFSGRWAREMWEDRSLIAPNGLMRRSTTGKPGFDGGNWVMVHAPFSGEVVGAHLLTHGDHSLTIECDPAGAADGRDMLQMAASYADAHVEIAPGSMAGGTAIFAWAKDRSTLAQSYHAYAREQSGLGRADWGPRKVHLNSWEALAFDLSEDKLKALAAQAAALGAERFVLDDGWFAGRRDDTTSLGDWTVSQSVFPSGLDPLIDHVRSLGMDFGLWVEPEMVSSDSDLYRAHPEWCLPQTGAHRPTMRGQLQLDLSHDPVLDHLYQQIHALLDAHDIAYLKWDHNRDMFPSRASQIAQANGLTRLLDMIRSQHPMVEIESCASGGGRISFDLLEQCNRFWPSDNNDPIERLRIMRSWTQFLPMEVLGNHVGPSPNPITGRRTDMDFRAKIAIFGHMGIEADPGTMRESERGVLAAHIALYKQWRDVLHTGDLWHLDHADPGISGLVVTHGTKALALIAQADFAADFDVAPVQLNGLEPDAQYRVTLPEPWPARASHYLASPDAWRAGITLSGTALMTQGLALPLTHPQTAWLIALERVAS